MIFVTVGHQMPFDRLIRAMDEWARDSNQHDIFAQIGRGEYLPQHFQSSSFLATDEFHQRLRNADAIVAHAGTGTIISALELGKPLLVLPRLSRFGETRNDHQVPTAQYFAKAGYVLAAADEHEMGARMGELRHFRPKATIVSHASAPLIDRLREFAFGD